VRALLEKEGQAIGAYDALIAAQAVRRGITLVTANTREFKRVDGLMWEDWALLKGSKGSRGSKGSKSSPHD
jgi:tRNA(fMet)-specific endonuclease VapC